MSTFTSFAPVYYSSFFYGLLGPWCNRTSTTLVTLLSFLCPILNVTLLVLFIFYSNGNVPPEESQSVSVLLNYTIIVAYSVIDALVLVMCFVHRKKIQGLFTTLEEIDQLLDDQHIQINHSRILWLNWGILFLVQGLSVLQLASTFLLYPVQEIINPQVLFRLLYKQFYHQSYVVLLVAVVHSILYRFRALNVGMEMLCSRGFLRGEGHRDSDKVMCLRGVLKRPTRSTICHLGVIHDKLCQTLPVIGKCFGLQTFCYVSLYLAITLMMMYRNFDQRISVEELGRKAVGELLPFIKTMTFLVLMTVTCTSVKREAKRTANVVHKVVNCNRLPELRLQLDTLSLQIYHCEADIHFAIIEFTWGLISTIFSLSTTYLLVLVQFTRMSSKSKE